MLCRKQVCWTTRSVGWLTLAMLASFVAAAENPPAPERSQKSPVAKASGAAGQPLFHGKSLKDWKITRFGGEGPVKVDQGRIVLGMGSPLTGITYDKEFPKSNYEITLQAMRLDGIDFFCALTFPVHDQHCTLVVGGWAGAVVGISCIDGEDASANLTTRYEVFDADRWYQIRVRVSGQHLSAWIDDERMVDLDTTNHELSTRIEVDLSKPLGIACFETRAAVRDIRLRKLETRNKTDKPKASSKTSRTD